MLFSVIIPAYNAKSYIEHCIKSVLNQNFPKEEYEIIVVDDCSPDGQCEVIKKIIQDNPKNNIKIIRHSQNKKQGGARNTGVLQANGKYIYFLDADDYWACKDVFSKFHECILKYPDIPIVESISHLDTISRDKFLEDQSFDLSSQLFSGEDFFTESGKYYGYVWTAAFLKDFILKTPFRENVFFEDGDWKLNVFLSSPKILVIDFPFCAYVSNPNSTIRGARKEVFQANIDVNLILLNKFLNYPSAKVRNKGLDLIKRNIISWFKWSKDYRVKDSYKVLDYASKTELLSLSNYSLSFKEKTLLQLMKHFTMLSILSVKTVVHSRRFLRKFLRRKNGF